MERHYELVVILDPELKAEEQEKLLTKIKKFVADGEGKILEAKEWGKKNLAYPISKKKTGIYHWFLLALSSEKTPAFRGKLQLEDGILRFLLINKGESSPLPEAKKPKKGARRS